MMFCKYLMFVSLLAPAVSLAAEGLNIMMLDIGFNHHQVQQTHATALANLNLSQLRTIRLPIGFGDRKEKDLLQINFDAYAKYNDEKREVAHVISAIGLAGADATGERTPDHFLPVVDPALHLYVRTQALPVKHMADLLDLMARYFAALDREIKAHDVRLLVKNSLTPREVLRLICTFVQLHQTLDVSVEICTEELARALADGYFKLFTSHPSLAVLVSAGDREDGVQGIDARRMNAISLVELAALRQPNVLVVGAVDLTGQALAPGAYWDPTLIRVGARGDIFDARNMYQTHHAYAAGYAAPRAAAAFASVLRAQPHLNGADSVRVFLAQATRREPLLSEYIQGGTILQDLYDPVPLRCDQLLLKRTRARLRAWWQRLRP